VKELRLRADFNGLFGDLVCLSHDDSAPDETGRLVQLSAGMVVAAYDLDSDAHGQPDNLVASGVVEPAPDWLRCNGSTWVLRIDQHGVRHQSEVDRSGAS
jgi:hypothetical protein